MEHHTGLASLLTLSVAVPVVVAMPLLAVRRLPRPVVDVAATATAAAVAVFDALLLAEAAHGRVVTWAGGWRQIGVVFVGDEIGTGAALLAATLVVASLLYSSRYYESAESQYQVLVLLFLAAMQGFALTGDLFDLFVFFELMGAAAYALTGFKVEDPTAVQGALNFAMVNTLGASFSLFGIGLLYARGGHLGLPQLAHTLAGQPVDGLLVAGFVLVSTGLLVKAAAVPFHFCEADAHAVAPTSICLLFSGIMVPLGLYGVGRLYFVVWSDVLGPDQVRRALVVAGALTAAVGAVMCFCQRHLKRLLAYSTIAHVGLFLAALGTLTPDGVAGAAVYVAGHAGVKGALFLLAGFTLNRYGSVDELDLYGRAGDALVGWLFVLGGFMLAGLPPFGAGLGKALAEEAVAKAGYWWGPPLFVVVSAVTGAAVIRAGLRVYFGVGPAPHTETDGDGDGGPADDDATHGEEDPDVSGTIDGHPPTMLVPILVLLAGTGVLGVAPGTRTAFDHAAEHFVDGHGYVGAALGAAGRSLSSASTGFAPGWEASALILGFVSAGLAAAVAAAALYAGRFPATLRGAASAALAPVRVVRRIHSGAVGDYVAWLLLGVAALAALIDLPRL